MALIFDQLPFGQQTLAEALRTQEKLRRISIPAELGEPSPGWADAYNKQLAKTPSAHSPFTSYQTAMSTIRAALSPALQDASSTLEEP